MQKQTTHGEVSALATALSIARGDNVRVDETDVRIYLSSPPPVRLVVMSALRASYIQQALDFLLNDDAPRA